MTLVLAREILALHELARLSIAQNGTVATDWIANKYCNGDRGKGLSLFYEAQDFIANREPCPHCKALGGSSDSESRNTTAK
jgi:hypothetical protein